MINSNTKQISFFQRSILLVHILPKACLSQQPAYIICLLSLSDLIDTTDHVKRFHVIIADQIAFAMNPDRHFFQIQPSILHTMSTAVCFKKII